jgi:CzcA family heavy metal efflux pump
MLNAVIRFSLRYRVLIVFLSLAVLIYGGYSATTLPIDVFPDLDRPRVTVMTECPGYAPEEVETLVNFPIEAAINGATGVEAVRSQSGPSLSVVKINFSWNTNIYVARQIVQERLNTVHLPPGIMPHLAPISSIMGQVMYVGMSRKRGPHEGELAHLPRTENVAEMALDPKNGAVSLYLLNAEDAAGKRIRDPHAWRIVTAAGPSVELTWSEPGASADPGLVTSPARYGKTNKIILQATAPGTFQAGDARLQGMTEDRWVRCERHARIYVDGQQHDLRFLTFLESQMELRSLADWVVRLRLLKITGVAQVVVGGGERKQYQALVDPRTLQQFGVTLDQVRDALQKNNRNASGGWVEKGDKEEAVRFLGRLGPEPALVKEELEKIPVKTTAERNILLKQVARVVEGPEIKRGDGSVNGLPGVLMTVTKQLHSDTRSLTDKILEALDEMEASLPPDIEINPNLFQMKRFIDLGLTNVGEALGIGAVLVLLILFLFLLNFRTTFISLTAIPLSLVVTSLVFKMMGWFTGTTLSINVMTLGGIAVAIGELVDDAIVDVENIFRRLRENNTLPHPRPVLHVVYDASVEIRSAIVFSTILVILVFVPLFALSGIEGRLFAPLGIAYIVSILASLLVSLTVTPVLSFYLLPQARATHQTADSPLLRFLKWLAGYMIRFSMNHAALILLATWVLVGCAAWQLSHIGSDFLPPFDEGSIQVNINLPPGSSLQASNRVSALVDDRFRQMLKTPKNPHGEIINFMRRTGRAELEEHADPVSTNESILSMNPESGRTREEVIAQIRHELEEMHLGADIEVEQPLHHLMSEMLSGVMAQIAIKVYGDDLISLRKTADEIRAAIRTVPGITPPVVEAQQQVDELHIRKRPDALAFYGVDGDYLADFIRTAQYGDVVSQVLDRERRFDLIVRLDDPFRNDFDMMGRLVVPTPKGPVALKMLVDMGEELGPNVVNRENVRRRIVVRVNTAGRDLGSAVADIQKRIKERVRLPQNYFVEYGGQFESQRRATYLISILSLVSLLAMFQILYILFPSTRIVLQILNALPAAFIGGVLALVVTNQTLTVASMVGFISLGGIAARNGILLMSHYFHLMRHEGESFSPQMILRGSLERLSPVLMTALTGGIGLLPLVIAGHAPGKEILYPVATVVVGGLITSTLCEFLVRPGLFWRFSGKDVQRLIADETASV